MSLADKVSILRILLTPFFVSFLIISSRFSLNWARYIALGLFIVAIFTDFFDGLVARLKKEKSDIGRVIDPLADKLLLVTSFIFLYFLKGFNIPWWVVLVVVSRDFMILLGIIILNFLKLEVPISPSRWGKLTTFFQMFTILSVLAGFKLSFLIWDAAVLFTVISGVGYIIRGVRSINVVGHSTGS